MLQFPPFARGNHGPARHQRRITGPRPAHAAANAGPRPATTRPNQPQPRPPGHARSSARPATAHRPTHRGVCTIRRTATACRRRVAPLMLQFPPFARGNHGPARHQRRITGPRPAHPAANAGPHPATTRPNQPRLRPPTHTQPPNRGFCTIRRTATACRRRVAPLMLQFPPFARGNHAPARHQRRITGPHPAHAAANAGPHPATTRPNQPQPRPPGHARSSARPATAHRPTHRGVCTIRRTATACRRRVAPLMLQFPHSPGQERLPHRRQPRRRPWQAHPTPHRAQPPPHPRSGSTPRPQPRASQPPATNGATFWQHPLFSQNEIRSTQFAYTVTNRSSTH